MALKKNHTLPGTGDPRTHFKIDRIYNVDELDKRAEFWVNGYLDGDKERGTHCAVLIFTGPAFDMFFSKDALKASDKDIYAVAYKAIDMWTSAEMAKRARGLSRLTYGGRMETFNDAARAHNVKLEKWRDDVRKDPRCPEPTPPVMPASPISLALTAEQEMLTTYATISGMLGGDIFNGATSDE